MAAAWGMEWKPNEHAYLHLSGGPQVDTSGCGKQQGYAYTADFSTRISQTVSGLFHLRHVRPPAPTSVQDYGRKPSPSDFSMTSTKDQSLGVDFGYVRHKFSARSLMGYSGFVCGRRLQPPLRSQPERRA